MKYRLEYSFSNAENNGKSDYTFAARTNEEALSKVKEIHQEILNTINKKISNPFWQYGVSLTRLVKIIQPEIWVEIKI